MFGTSRHILFHEDNKRLNNLKNKLHDFVDKLVQFVYTVDVVAIHRYGHFLFLSTELE